MPSKWQRLKPRLAPLLQCYLIQFFTGMNDGNLGIVLPSIQSHYDVSQSIVALVFLCYASGFAAAAVLNGWMVRQLTQAKTVVVGAASLTLGFGMILIALPFPALCIFYIFVGLGVALIQSGANVFVGELPNATMMLNFLHASYGLGALVGPFAASSLLERTTWNMTYVVLCGIAGMNTVTAAVSFHDEDTVVADADADTDVPERGVVFATLRERVTQVGAVFLLFYVGTEVTLGDWAYTFLITERSDDTQSMAKVMSGYWAGLCIGRLCLGWVTSRFGEKQMVYGYIGVLNSTLITFWLVKSVWVDCVALVLAGIALGPLFPTLLSIARQTIPCRLYATAVGLLSAFGSGGSALFPYLTGVLINSTGVTVVPPLTMAMACVLFIGWLFIPNPA
ncbi:major facilitator superfamily domain-containing protein [Dichotomocladium elegans]|nr:major facilitator superfamily domain-containing protein [Dichotomocladium elegans]